MIAETILSVGLFGSLMAGDTVWHRVGRFRGVEVPRLTLRVFVAANLADLRCRWPSMAFKSPRNFSTSRVPLPGRKTGRSAA